MVSEKHILFIVENTTAPLDQRVWREAGTLKDKGYQVSVICPQKGDYTKRYEIINGIEIFRHPMLHEADGKYGFIIEYLNAFFWELFLSIKIFFNKPFHYIHAANPPDNIFLISLIYKIFGVKYVFDHHDICPEVYLAKFERKDIFYHIQICFEKFTFKTADIVISTNESYKKIAINRGKKRKEQVFVVRNGPDLSTVDFVPPNKELKNGFDYLIAYVGVIGKQEGIENLLNIANCIICDKKIKNIKFIIIGTGPHWHHLVNLSKCMGLEDYVQFTGYIPFREFYEILATADICVNPEFKNDFTDKSTMIKIMDYMVFRRPIVQFDTTEGRVTAGEASLYVDRNDESDFAETLIELLEDKCKRNKMGEAGWKRICTKLNWQKQQMHLLSAYNYLENIYQI